jgi:hypothetical protein
MRDSHEPCRVSLRAVAAFAAALLVAVAVAAGCEAGGTSKRSADSRTLSPSPSAADRSPSPTVSELNPGFVAELFDRVALRRLLARQKLSFETVDYASPSDAAAELRFCPGSRYPDCQFAVLTTGDNWATATGAVIHGDASTSVGITALPGGSVAVAMRDSGYKPVVVPPFILHPDGTAVSLRISTADYDPGPDSVLIGKPSFAGLDGVDAALLAIDPNAAEVHPVSHQPCDCQYADGPYLDLDGTAHVWTDEKYLKGAPAHGPSHRAATTAAAGIPSTPRCF